MDSKKSLYHCAWRIGITAVLMLFMSSAPLANELRFSSNKYLYSIALPTGWMQIPSDALARLRSERFPPQAQHLIFDAAFQRGNAGNWFEWPYVVVQVIPSDRTKIRRLPTEAEFQQFVTDVSGGKVLNKAREAIDAVRNPEDRAFLKLQLAALANATVQVDVASRKYWFVLDVHDPLGGAIKTFIAGAFMPDGKVVQLNAYTKASRFNQHLGQFLTMTRSLHQSPGP